MLEENLEQDRMICRACGNEERASEGYPCADCGTFLCLLCTFRGVTLCSMCERKQKDAADEEMSDSVVLRERLALGDRTFTVLAEPWYNAASDEWKGRYLYVPLDRSLASPVASSAVKRARKRDDLVRQLGAATDRELTKAFNSIPIPGARRSR